jgi:hypothetical protein
MLNSDGSVKGVTQNQQLIKAIVVETDITKTQKKVSNIKEMATFS